MREKTPLKCNYGSVRPVGLALMRFVDMKDKEELCLLSD